MSDQPTYLTLESTGETHIEIIHRQTTRAATRPMNDTTFTLAQGDTEPPVEARLLDEDRKPIFDSLGVSVRRLHFRAFGPSDEPVIDGRAEMVDRDLGLVRYRFSSDETDIVDGSYRAVFVIETRRGELSVPNADNFTLRVTR